MENQKFYGVTMVFCLMLVLTNTTQATNPTAGVYKTVNEFNSNSPSLPFTDSFYTQLVRYGFWGLTSKDRLAFQKMAIDKNRAKALNKVFAFSDGQQVYIKLNGFKMRKVSKFAKAEPVGRFLCYTDLGVYVVRQMPLLWWTYPQAKFVDYKTGKLKNLSSFAVRRTIKDNQPLLDKFKHDKKRANSLKFYLAEYSKGI